MTTGDKAKQVLHEHFRKQFDSSEECIEQESELPHWSSKMYEPVQRIQQDWYSSLMVDFTEKEVQEIMMRPEYRVAAGEDGVGAGVWKVLVTHQVTGVTLRLLRLFLNQCLRLRKLPLFGKMAVIVPFFFFF